MKSVRTLKRRFGYIALFIAEMKGWIHAHDETHLFLVNTKIIKFPKKSI